MSLRITRRIAAIAAVVAVAVLTVAAPAHASPITTVGWSISQPQPGALNVRYTWSFTTVTTATINYVTMTVPSGTTVPGVLTPQDYYGLSIGTASYNAGTSTVTYQVTTPASIAGGTSILISIDGFTNTATPGNAYTSVVTTQLAGNVVVDSGTTTNSVAINDTSTAVTIVVARSTAFSSNTTGFDLLMDASVPGKDLQYKDVQLTVKTNAASGYTLRTQIDHQPTGVGTGTTLPAVAGAVGGTVVSPPANTFGYKVQGSTGTGTAGSQMTTGYAGYTAAVWGTAFFSGVPTNGDVITIRNQAYIDFLQRADKYTASITYSVTPSY